ncbi:MAG TPA: alpha-ketoglutarate-dependent dioxygenase AlkB [Bacteroidia bacterium]|nr:alpha-ketoglutarate-dependent dioxygenase AlkB [Bacteroidia bacterium]
MLLFNHDSRENLLPMDGELYYFGTIFEENEANHWLKILSEKIDWKNDELMMFGKKIITKRKVALYANQTFTYTYSKQSKQALIWTPELQLLKQIIEHKSQQHFNSCLLNLYHHGKESMGWHSDNETELEDSACIASVSFGAERKFMFKHNKSKTTISLHLGHGSLLLMQGSIQQHWQHQLPPMARVQAPRINLTFRRMKV